MLIHFRNFTVLLALALLTRLPHVLSEHFVLDSDESVLGICLRLMMEGGQIYWLFPGQKYGLIMPELLAALPAAWLGGISALTIKLPQLFWFVLGAYFIFLLAKQKSSPRFAWILAILLVTCSTWFLWGMRIRGGYVTAFALSNALIYLSNCHASRSPLRIAMMGLGLGVLFHLQALWSIGTAFFVLASLAENRNVLKPVGAVILGIAVGWLIPNLARPDYLFYDPQFFTFDPQRIAGNASIYFSYFERNLNGLYLHGRAFTELWATQLYVLLCGMLAFGVWGLSTVQIFRDPERRWQHAAGVGAMATVFVVPLFLVSAAPRYALPLFSFLFPALVLLLEDKGVARRMKKWVVGFCVCLTGLSIAIAMQSAQIKVEDYTTEDMEDLMEYLSEEEVVAVLTNNAGLQWQVMFYANGEIPARNRPIHDRIPTLTQRATSGYNTDPEHAALVELSWEYDETTFGRADWTNGIFSVRLAPPYERLSNLGFQGLHSKEALL
ncbi:MAG: hypothetical protein HQ500_08805 [Flavobacteriales bacterium]|nr:hypothetical protein [Flavobacteriales bacterium]